jgi:hypothetical protein
VAETLTFLRAEDEQWHQPEPVDPSEPTARCQWPIHGDPKHDLACDAPAYYVITTQDEYGREVIDLECVDHLIDVLQAATVCYPCRPIEVSLVRTDSSAWDLAREQWVVLGRTKRRRGQR